MSFHCRNYDLTNGRCNRLGGECVPGRRGCILEGRIAVTEELAEKICQINEETAQRGEKNAEEPLIPSLLVKGLGSNST